MLTLLVFFVVLVLVVNVVGFVMDRLGIQDTPWDRPENRPWDGPGWDDR